MPVGEDQDQHVELARAIARRFNYRLGTPCFPEPRSLHSPTPRILSLADPTRKMSKSLGPRHYVGLFEEPASIREKVRAAVTDSGILPPGVAMSPGVANLFTILAACGAGEAHAALTAAYAAGNRQYADLKEAVADALIALTTPLRARRAALLADPAAVERQVRALSDRAQDEARATLREVRALLGLPAWQRSMT